MKQIQVSIPTYSGQVPIELLSRMSNLKVPEGYKLNLSYVKGLLITEARYGMGYQCLEHKNDYLLFIDSDQVPSQNVIEEMIKLDKDIVGCPIPSRRGAKFIAVFDKDMNRLDEWEGTKQCGAVGMATTLIKREVIEKLYDKWANPFEVDAEKHDGKWVKYSEDVMFCKRARKEGFEVWCTDKVISEHIGDPVAYWYHKGYHNTFNDKL